MPPEYTQWHRLFGFSWIDYLHGQPAEVFTENDFTDKKQLLDVLICTTNQPLQIPLPDGFEQLTLYNLITFKSFQDTLDRFTLKELVGHGVNCRKSRLNPQARMYPESDFTLFAVCIRYPQLLSRQADLRLIQPGVYEAYAFNEPLRIIVVHQLPQTPNNAMFHLLSANDELVKYGRENYQIRNPETSTLLLRLLRQYQTEGILMAETLKEFAERTAKEFLAEMPIEKRLEGIPLEKRLEGIPLEKRLEGISLEDLLKGLSEADQIALAERILAKKKPS